MSAATATQPDSRLQVVQPTPIANRGPRLGLPTRDELAALLQYGEIMVKSGMVPKHIATAEAAIVVMRYGHQLGVDEFTALQHMYVINGKPAADASLLQSVMQRDHGGGAVRVKKFTSQEVVIECRRRDTGDVAEVSYTWQEAENAGLPKANPTWNKYPADMLFARCISRAGRQVFRDSTMGMYTPEEIGGNYIEVNVQSGEPEVIQVDGPSGELKSAQPAANPNRLARLHAIGGERGLDHDALHRIAMLKIGKSLGDRVLTDKMLSDFESLIETSSDEDLLLWQMDWNAEIRATEPQGEQALLDLGQRIKAAGVTRESHPGIEAFFRDALTRAREVPQEGLFRDLPPEPTGDAGDDRFTA
jgi:hypothetical protein